MYTGFEDDELVHMDGIFDHINFFYNLPRLLPYEDYILGLASLMPTEEIGVWLQSLPSLIIPGRYNFRFLTKTNKETQWGGAYYLHATKGNLEQLCLKAKLVDNPALFCSHVIAFSKVEPLFNFHDAFEGGDLVVSSKVPIVQIQAFCSELRASYKIVQNPQTPEGRKAKLATPQSEFKKSRN